MRATILLILVLELIFTIRNIDCAGAPKFHVNVNTDGSYSILVNDATWLTSGDTAFNGNGRTHAKSDQSLQVNARATSHGSDQFGPFSSTSFSYHAGAFAVNTSIKAYTNPNLPAAIFTQKYLGPATNTSAKSTDDVISKFPSFQLGHNHVELGYLAYGGSMAGYSRLKLGRFNQNSTFTTGIKGGPLVLFDKTNNVLVISPASQFMAASSSIDPQRQINWGIMGLVDHVPEGYSIDFIVYYSDKGVNEAIRSWGNYLTTRYQKSTDRRDNDPTIKYLGYWTDNGAYYYYNTEKGKNYETTILDVVEYSHNISVPFKYIQYDSWWYPKGSHTGVKTWVPESSVFPHGMKYISDKIKLPLAYHNRFWDGETTYAKYNGGPYNFIRDHESGLSVPDDIHFWEDLFNKTTTWGKFLLYEQDWLDIETEENVALRNDLFLGQRWLLQMGQAAEKFGPVNIQYCMSYGRHILQALEIPAVTQARVSDDYHPGNHQWNIGISSILVDSLNIAPFKDTFYTTGRQPGDPYKNAVEPNTRLQALISTLSTGPVGPGDGIGFINKSLLMKCCDSNGLILKPAKPATAIDDQIKRAAFQSTYAGPSGDVYTTHTVISGFFFGIVVAAGLNNNYSLTPASAWPTVKFPDSLAFSESNPKALSNFSSHAPIRLGHQCTLQHFCLYYTSPLIKFDNGETFAILGELDKWVPMSHQRFNSIQTTGTDFLIQLKVQPRESVTFTFYVASKHLVKSVTCDNSKNSSPALSTVISIAKETCTVA